MREVFLGLVLLMGGVGCQRDATVAEPAAAPPVPQKEPASLAMRPAPVVPLGSAPLTSTSQGDLSAAADPSADATAGDYPRGLPLAEIEAPFTPGPDHSRIVPASEAGAIDAHRLYAFRSPDADAPPLEQPASGHLIGNVRQVVSELLVVRTDPGARVAFWGAALGTFATGAEGIVVQADAEGIAQVQFRGGQDAGEYLVHAASPARSGTVTFVIAITP